MKQYKQPETRIKRVKDYSGEKFYAQYKIAIIPYIWWEWHNTRPNIEDLDFAFSLEEAKFRVDLCLDRFKNCWESELQVEESLRAIKKEVEYIDYP